ELADSRLVAERFEWNRRAQRDADRNCRQRAKLRERHRDHVPEQDGRRAHASRVRLNYVWHGAGILKHIAGISENTREQQQAEGHRQGAAPIKKKYRDQTRGQRQQNAARGGPGGISDGAGPSYRRQRGAESSHPCRKYAVPQEANGYGESLAQQLRDGPLERSRNAEIPCKYTAQEPCV